MSPSPRPQPTLCALLPCPFPNPIPNTDECTKTRVQGIIKPRLSLSTRAGRRPGVDHLQPCLIETSTRNHFGRRSVARDHGSDDGGASLLNNWTGLRDTSLGDGGAASHKRTPRPSRQTLRTGWRMGALIALIVATTVCILNFSITMWVYLRVHGINSTTGILYYGNCAKARRFNVLIHLLVNVLGTLLLDASSYCMQVLSAPNRNELARAHTQRYWLHIGVPSWRNLKWIGKDRVLLWALLLLSSVPLHLLFNSVIVLSLQANEYAVLPVTEKWLQNSTLDTSAFLNVNESKITQVQETFAKYSFKVQNNSTALINGLLATYDNVTTQECFNRYSTQYVSTSGHVYLIHKDPPVYRDGSLWAPYFNKTGNFQWLTASMRDRVDPDKKLVKGTANFTFPWQSFPDFYPSNGWRCPSRTVGSCNVENRFEVPQDRSKWEPYESAVKYCLVERVQESCSLRFSFPIAIAVIVANFVKAICMALTLFVYRKHAAVVTVGDAIANFLDHPENATKGRCLHNRSMLKDKWGWEYLYGVRKDKQPVRPEELHGRFNRWFEAPSGARWLATYVL